jgi:hypothetical protein
MFAMGSPPPERLEIGGVPYRLVRVFKHDFWAATSLYEAAYAGEGVDFPRVVVKFGRKSNFAGLPLRWTGRLIQRHEQAIYERLAGVEGVPRWVGRIGNYGYALEYMEGAPLDHFDKPPAGYFERMRAIFDAAHARGVAYCDANKRSNMLVGPDGQAVLIDFQISVRTRDDLPWPLGWLIRRFIEYMKHKDIYHLYKHKRRLVPDELTSEEEALSRRRSGLHLLHRKLTKPYRALRRRFLRKQYTSGRLVSPTAELEDHHQPEKATWQEPAED